MALKQGGKTMSFLRRHHEAVKFQENKEYLSINLRWKQEILYCPLGEIRTPSPTDTFGHTTPADTEH